MVDVTLARVESLIPKMTMHDRSTISEGLLAMAALLYRVGQHEEGHEVRAMAKRVLGVEDKGEPR